MKPTPGQVRDWAETVLHQLGDPLGRTLSVAPRRSGGGGAEGGPEVPPGGPPFTSRLRTDAGSPADLGSGTGSGSGILVTVTFADGSSAGTWLEDALTVPDAVVKLAGQLQDAVLEQTGEAALPPCPAAAWHQHPATARVLRGIPSWTCPTADEGRTRPVL